jgi:glycosyltransferase involved in cell wall biosynthesis
VSRDGRRAIVVNGRFLTMTATGVQRYARELLPRLTAELGDRMVVAVPPHSLVRGDDPEIVARLAAPAESRWHGIAGHWWEQQRLPRLFRQARGAVLWSPCDWGPLVVRDQVPVIHDIGPLTDPEWFTPAYRALARVMTRPLVTRSARVATPSSRVAVEIGRVIDVAAEHIAVVPPGVGEPFASWPLDDLATRRPQWCVLVGAHDARKNAGFLVDLWPEVHRRIGLRLFLTRRSVVTTRGDDNLDRFHGVPGVDVIVDPSDTDLAELYAGALCLLWPSHFEGYGFPLLESMAVGTPYLSTDTGAAAELAVDPAAQLLPLDPGAWVRRIVDWAAGGAEALREQCATKARALTWDASAAATAALLERVADEGG